MIGELHDALHVSGGAREDDAGGARDFHGTVVFVKQQFFGTMQDGSIAEQRLKIAEEFGFHAPGATKCESHARGQYRGPHQGRQRARRPFGATVATSRPCMLLNLSNWVKNAPAAAAGASGGDRIVSKPKILVTKLLFPAARAVLDKIGEVDWWTGPEAISRTELLKRVADKDALVCLLNDRIDAELLAAGSKLRVVATVSVGYDNIDVPACTARRVIATNTPGVLDDTTADLAWALMLAIARRLVEGDAWVRSGNWRGFSMDHLLGGDVYGKTLGIIGFGRIGRCVAKRGLGFGMRVLYSGATTHRLKWSKN